MPTTALPDFIAPQLASLVDNPPDGDEWIHEIKLDGYRVLSRVDSGRARLLTRRSNDWTARFAALAESIVSLPLESGYLDGEIVKLDAAGRSSFQALQEALSGKDGSGLTYFVFDLLYLNGQDLTNLSLESRKRLLAGLLKQAAPDIRYSEHVVGRGKAFYEQACRLGLEGVVCKRRDGKYHAGRAADWRKVKCGARQEFVIAGFTEPEGERKHFGALVLGVYDRNGTDLRYVGKVGTGFDTASLRILRERFRPLETDRSPFAPASAAPARGVHWMRPALVAEVSFSNWTRDGLLRQASFQGLREDKEVRDVVRERPTTAHTTTVRRLRRGAVSPTEVAGVVLTHPDKVLYPEQGTTKLDLARYYEQVSDRILPHIIHRPLSLIRCPDGYAKECFFQRHANRSIPRELDRIKTKTIRDETGPAPYLYIEDLAGLISLVQLGVLEIHPWGSPVAHLEHPDVVTLDLDPGPDVPWNRVLTLAGHLHRRLEALDLKSFVKTTGGKGLHVVVPLLPRHSWDDIRGFARSLADEIVRLAPGEYTSKVSKQERKGRILIDYLRNARGATAVAAYSTRARAGAPVSTPLRWNELTGAVRSNRFTVNNLRDRLARMRKDPWADYFETQQVITPRIRKELGLV